MQRGLPSPPRSDLKLENCRFSLNYKVIGFCAVIFKRLFMTNVRCLFIICVFVYNFCYCCTAETSSSAVQISYSKLYGNLSAPTLYSIPPWLKICLGNGCDYNPGSDLFTTVYPDTNPAVNWAWSFPGVVAETVLNKVGWPTYSWMPGIHIEKDMNYSMKIDTNYSVEKDTNYSKIQNSSNILYRKRYKLI